MAVLAPEQATRPTNSSTFQASNAGRSGLQKEKDEGPEAAKESTESTDTIWF